MVSSLDHRSFCKNMMNNTCDRSRVKDKQIMFNLYIMQKIRIKLEKICCKKSPSAAQQSLIYKSMSPPLFQCVFFLFIIWLNRVIRVHEHGMFNGNNRQLKCGPSFPTENLFKEKNLMILCAREYVSLKTKLRFEMAYNFNIILGIKRRNLSLIRTLLNCPTLQVRHWCAQGTSLILEMLKFSHCRCQDLNFGS